MATYRVQTESGEYDVETSEEKIAQEPVKESQANPLESILAGTMKGGASLLQAEQNATNLVYKTSPLSMLLRGAGVLKEEPSQVFGDLAKKANEYADYNIPERKGVLSNVLEGASEVPSLVAQVSMLGGGTTGLTAQGALQGSENGVGQSVLQGATNFLLGNILHGVGKIKPGVKSTSLKSKIGTGVARATIGGSTFAIPGVLQGDESDKVVAHAILGAGMAIPTGNGKNLTEDIKGYLIKVSEPRLRVRALETLGRTRNVQEQELNSQKSKAKLETEPKLSEIESYEKSQKSIITDEQKARQDTIDKKQVEAQVEKEAQLQAESIQLQNDLNNLEVKTNNIIKARASELQPQLMRLFKDKSDQYGPKYDAVANKIDKETPITYGEAYSLLKSAREESINDADINFGKPFELINKLISKYNPGTDPNNPALDSKGNRIIRDESESISFAEFRRDLKKVEKQMNYGGRPSPEDIPGHILKSKSGEYLAKKDTEFADLQGSYSRVIQAMNRASKSFAVYKGEFQNDVAETTLRSIREGKTSGALDRTIDFLKSGTKEFPGGIGDKFSDIRGLGKEKSVLNSLYESKTNKVKSNYDRRVGELERQSTNLQREINDRKIEIEKMSESKKAQVLAEYKSKIDSLEKQFKESQVGEGNVRLDKRIDRARQNLRKMNILRSTVSAIVTAGAFAGVGAGRIAASRLASAAARDINA